MKINPVRTNRQNDYGKDVVALYKKVLCISVHLKSIFLTKFAGGGPAGKPLTPLAEAVESVIGTDNISISGIPGAVDTTFLMLDNEHNTANIAYV